MLATIVDCSVSTSDSSCSLCWQWMDVNVANISFVMNLTAEKLTTELTLVLFFLNSYLAKLECQLISSTVTKASSASYSFDTNALE